METKEVQPTKGKLGTKKAAIGFSVIGLVCTAGIVYVVKHKKAQAQKTSETKEVKYVFFSMDGKPITLSEQDVFEIKQLHEDGVLPTVIGDRFCMDAVMVCRVINSVKTI